MAFNLTAGHSLIGTLKKLRIAWTTSEDGWKDAVRQDFEAKQLAPLEAQIEATVHEIADLAKVFATAEKECS